MCMFIELNTKHVAFSVIDFDQHILSSSTNQFIDTISHSLLTNENISKRNDYISTKCMDKL